MELSLDDVIGELKPSDDVVEVINVLFQSLKSLNDIRNDVFVQKLFKSTLIKEYYTEKFNESQEAHDSSICYIDISDRFHTLEDVFIKYTTGKPVPVPNEQDG